MVLNILFKIGFEGWEFAFMNIHRINPGSWGRSLDLASITRPPMPTAMATLKGHTESQAGIIMGAIKSSKV